MLMAPASPPRVRLGKLSREIRFCSRPKHRNQPFAPRCAGNQPSRHAVFWNSFEPEVSHDCRVLAGYLHESPVDRFHGGLNVSRIGGSDKSCGKQPPQMRITAKTPLRRGIGENREIKITRHLFVRIEMNRRCDNDTLSIPRCIEHTTAGIIYRSDGAHRT